MKRRGLGGGGIESFHHEPARRPQERVAGLIRSLDDDERVHGILLQLPLPDHLDQDPLISLIDPAKDVDGLTPISAGLLAQGATERSAVHAGGGDGAAARGGRRARRRASRRRSAARSWSASRSPRCCSPPTPPSPTATPAPATWRRVCREADVLVAAVGLAAPRHRRDGPPGAIVIDVGTNRTESGSSATSTSTPSARSPRRSRRSPAASGR